MEHWKFNISASKILVEIDCGINRLRFWRPKGKKTQGNQKDTLISADCKVWKFYDDLTLFCWISSWNMIIHSDQEWGKQLTINNWDNSSYLQFRGVLHSISSWLSRIVTQQNFAFNLYFKKVWFNFMWNFLHFSSWFVNLSQQHGLTN